MSGRPSELFELTGAVVRLGAGAQPPVPTPTHNFVLAALVPQEKEAKDAKKREATRSKTRRQAAKAKLVASFGSTELAEKEQKRLWREAKKKAKEKKRKAQPTAQSTAEGEQAMEELLAEMAE